MEKYDAMFTRSSVKLSQWNPRVPRGSNVFSSIRRGFGLGRLLSRTRVKFMLRWFMINSAFLVSPSTCNLWGRTVVNEMLEQMKTVTASLDGNVFSNCHHPGIILVHGVRHFSYSADSQFLVVTSQSQQSGPQPVRPLVHPKSDISLQDFRSKVRWQATQGLRLVHYVSCQWPATPRPLLGASAMHQQQKR
jgi:hypothetical protein